MTVNIDRLVILHGYSASPHSHWFDWMADQLEPLGVETTVPAMPDSANPDGDAWVAAAIAAIDRPAEDLVIVGHSLGVITGLLALDRFEGDWRLGGFMGVAGFADPHPAIRSERPFSETAPDVTRTAARTRARGSIRSDFDAIVPTERTKAYADQFGAEDIVIDGGRHFLGSEGWNEFPALLAWMQRECLPS